MEQKDHVREIVGENLIWSRWIDADFSWDGLATKQADGYENLQAYWRRDPNTGENRSDEVLRASGELVELEGQQTFHIIHLPLQYVDGTPTRKAIDNAEIKNRQREIIKARTKSAAAGDKTPLLKMDGAVVTLQITFGMLPQILQASWVGAVFCEPVNFKNMHFHDDADFRRASFLKAADFNASRFLGRATFFGAHFHRIADFGRSVFTGRASFWGTIFFDDAVFQQAIFFERANFWQVKFKKKLRFNVARFEKRVFFGSIQWPVLTVDSHRAFEKVIFQDLADFTGAGFKSLGAFDGARFERGVILDKVSERDAAKVFAGELKDASDRDAVTSSQQGKAQAGKRKMLRELQLEHLEGGCRVLKQEMEKISDKNRAQQLFTFELIARRCQRSTPWAEKFFSHLYAWTSDYGNSQAKPLLCLGLLWIVFSGVYLTFGDPVLVIQPVEKASIQENARVRDADTDVRPVLIRAGKVKLSDNSEQLLTNAATVSASRLFPFGPFEDVSKEYANNLRDDRGALLALIFRVTGTLQSFLALVLAFSFGLAVRRRFQIS